LLTLKSVNKATCLTHAKDLWKYYCQSDSLLKHCYANKHRSRAVETMLNLLAPPIAAASTLRLVLGTSAGALHDDVTGPPVIKSLCHTPLSTMTSIHRINSAKNMIRIVFQAHVEGKQRKPVLYELVDLLSTHAPRYPFSVTHFMSVPKCGVSPEVLGF
jgi:hypothetical protein